MRDADAFQETLATWRRDLHAKPEFGFDVKETAAFVAATLRGLGFDQVVEGVGGSGVVGVVKRGAGNRAIALRADMDALRITEANTCPHQSTRPGLMHACGHDGHTAMLLGAAQILAEDGGFDGSVVFIFQPAEEWGKGAIAMLEDGLLERFPFAEIFGLHNMPGMAEGVIYARPGPLMAAEDNFEITLRGVGGHSSRPHSGQETLIAASALVLELQTIVSRRLNPAEMAVVSVTELVTDGTRNVLPGVASIRGDCRSFTPEVSAEIERHMRRISEGVALAHGVAAEVTYTREFIPLMNEPACTDAALAAAREALGDERVALASAPITASEDFAQFLERVPGCFVFLGAGATALPLHNPGYDFNDALLSDGARFFATLARRQLPL